MANATPTQAVFQLYSTIGAGLPSLWNEEIPEDQTQEPSAYFLHEGEIAGEYHTQRAIPAQVVFTFTIVFYHHDSDICEAYGNSLMAVFKGEALQLESYPNAKGHVVEQKTAIIGRTKNFRGMPQRSKETAKVYMCSIQYVVSIANPRY